MEAQGQTDWRDWMRGLGRQARRVREFLGLSQEQLARLAGVSQGAVSRLEAGRGLATPLLVVVKLHIAMHKAISAYDPEVLSPEARRFLVENEQQFPTGPDNGFPAYPVAKDQGIEELVRLYRGLPERQREKMLSVVRATASALAPADAEGGSGSVDERRAG